MEGKPGGGETGAGEGGEEAGSLRRDNAGDHRKSLKRLFSLKSYKKADPGEIRKSSRTDRSKKEIKILRSNAEASFFFQIFGFTDEEIEKTSLVN